MFRPLPRTRSRLAALACATVLLAGACSGADDSDADATTSSVADGSADSSPTTEATTESTSSTEPAPTTRPSTTSTSSTTTTTTTSTTVPPPRGASPDDPAPVGDPAFDVVGYGFDEEGADVSITGLVEVPARDGREPGGQCLAILMSVTGDRAEGVAVIDSAIARPALLLDDGSEAEIGLDCDQVALAEAGWIDRFGVRPTVGGVVHIGATFVVPIGSSPSVIAVGPPDADETRYYEPTLLAEIPPAPESTPGERLDLLDVTEPAAATVSVTVDDTDWEITVSGIVPTARLESAVVDVPGQCYLVIGTATATSMPSVIIDALSTPAVRLVAGGGLHPVDTGDCDDNAVVQAGYTPFTFAAYGADNTFGFTQSVFVPAGLQPGAIVVLGRAGEPEFFAFEPLVLDPVPAAPPRELVNPPIDTVAAGTPVTASSFDSDWTATITGLVPLAIDVAIPVDCYAVVGSIDNAGADDVPADVGLIAGGALYRSGITIVSCDESGLIDAGYVPLSDYRATPLDAPAPFYETILLPTGGGSLGAIVFGNPASVDDVAYVEPVVLDAVPAP